MGLRGTIGFTARTLIEKLVSLSWTLKALHCQTLRKAIGIANIQKAVADYMRVRTQTQQLNIDIHGPLREQQIRAWCELTLSPEAED